MKDSEKDFYNNLNVFTVKSHEEYIKNKENIDINLWNPDLNNALVHALENEDYNKAKWLLSEGIMLKDDEVYIEDRENNCFTAQECFKLTIDKPDLQKEMIIKGLKITPISDLESVGIFMAKYAANVDILKILIDNGHKPYIQKEMRGRNAGLKTFNLLNEIKPDVELWDFILLNNLGDINSVNYHGRSLLFDCEDMDKIDYLIEKGINLNIKSEDGSTALFGASLNKTKKLIQSGIDINAKNTSGENALLRTDDKDVALLLLEKGISTTGDVFLWSEVNREWVKEEKPIEFMKALEKTNINIFNLIQSIKEKELINSNIDLEKESDLKNKKRL